MSRVLTSIFTVFLMLPVLWGQQTVNGTIQHNGVTREYILYAPASYTPGTDVPLLLAFHGYTSNAAVLRTYSKFNDIADTAGFIVVYPQGTVFNGNTHWNVGGLQAGSPADDLGFTDALLDSLIVDFSIDQTRIYSTGMSNGGYMSFLLACQLSSRIAAIASVTGSMSLTTFDACTPSRPISVLQIHGTTDGTVPYVGNPLWTKSIDEVLEYWATNNNCELTPTSSSVPDVAPMDGSTVEHFVYANGDNCTSVEHYRVIGGGHDWPGAWGNMDISASALVWNFVSKYDINGLIGCPSVGIEDNVEEMPVDVYPNPAEDHVYVSNSFQYPKKYELWSAGGKLVKSGKVSPGEQFIDLSKAHPGVYFLHINEQVTKIIVHKK